MYYPNTPFVYVGTSSLFRGVTADRIPSVRRTDRRPGPSGLGPRGPRWASVLALVGCLGMPAVAVWQPWRGLEPTTATMAPVRAQVFWTLLVDGLVTVAAVVGFAVVVASLLDRRGRRWAGWGAALASGGAVVFALGQVGLGTALWFLSSPEAGTATDHVLGAVVERATPIGVVHAAGFVLMNLGLLLLAVAVARSRLVGRGWPIVLAGLLLTHFVVPNDLVTDVAMVALPLVLAAMVVRLPQGARRGRPS